MWLYRGYIRSVAWYRKHTAFGETVFKHFFELFKFYSTISHE